MAAASSQLQKLEASRSSEVRLALYISWLQCENMREVTVRGSTVLAILGKEDGLKLFEKLLISVASTGPTCVRLLPGLQLTDNSQAGLIIRRRGRPLPSAGRRPTERN